MRDADVQPLDRVGEPGLVSAIVPVRDGARYLREALDSILAQAYRPLEVIVVDDGSTDGSAGIAAARDPIVRVISRAPGGAAAARNAGVLASRGAWLCFLDADDRFAPDKLERQLAVLDAHPEALVCLATAENVWEPGFEHEEALYRAHGKVRATYHFGTMLARRAAFAEVGLLDPALTQADQPEWFARMADRGVGSVVIDDVLMTRRMHPESSSHRDTGHDEFLDLVKARIDRRRAGR